MLISALQGVVRRRILVNFRVDPTVMQRHVPRPFELQLVDGWATAGICLLRLEHLRPAHLPAKIGVSSENAAHRVAVSWSDDAGRVCSGVYIPRRDTASAVNAFIGWLLFSCDHH